MKKLLVISLICFSVSGTVLAERPPSSFNSIYEIDGCVEWGSLIWCADCPCTTTQAMALAANCMNNNRAQGYEIHKSYTPTPLGPVDVHWDIYYKYCTLDENGDNPSGIFGTLVTNALQALFHDQVVVSERLTDLDGQTRIYVIDYLGGGFFETTWNEDGGLVDFHGIDPETDDGFNFQLDEGLGFYLLELSSDE